LDRQSEFVARTDFLWKAKLKIEQEEVEIMRGINKVGFNGSDVTLK
jgi:adenylate cyclase 2